MKTQKILIRIFGYKKYHKIMMKIVSFSIRLRHNEETLMFWCWEMTPMPCGPPSFSQYMDGIKLGFTNSPLSNNQ